MAYQPDPRPRLAKATRFFARLLAFDLECPACGAVYVIRKRTTGGKWDPTTARFACTRVGCDRTFVLGMVAWPIGPRAASQPPEDQVPNLRQLAALRREGGGWWMADEDRLKHPRPNETNLTALLERPDEDDLEDA